MMVRADVLNGTMTWDDAPSTVDISAACMVLYCVVRSATVLAVSAVFR